MIRPFTMKLPLSSKVQVVDALAPEPAKRDERFERGHAAADDHDARGADAAGRLHHRQVRTPQALRHPHESRNALRETRPVSDRAAALR
jgi:hypothetical protein